MQGLHQLLLGGGGQLSPQLGGRPQQGVGQKGGIDHRLPAPVEVQKIRRLGVDAVGDGLPGQLGQALLARGLGGGHVGQLQPGGQAGQGAAQGFEVRHVAAAGLLARGGFYGHSGFQLAPGGGGQHRLGNGEQGGQPVVAVGRPGGGWAGRGGREPAARPA